MASPGSPTGLSQREADRRLERFGPNEIPQRPGDPPWRKLARQFASPLVLILLLALAADLAAWTAAGARDTPLEAIAIAAILLLNAVLGAVQEHRADRALQGLEQLLEGRVWALRDGRFRQLGVAALVPGDLVRLQAGDRVPADGELEGGGWLALDESTLTGESAPVERRSGEPALAGTLVTRGGADLRVERTGARSATGRLAEMLGVLRPEPTPLERRLTKLGRLLAVAVTVLALALGALGVWLQGPSQLERVFLFAVALAVAAVPEGLPVVLSFALALGTERMARRRAVVRRLAAVEALGSVTVIATDKTGTLTENRLRLARLDAPDPRRALQALALCAPLDEPAAAHDPLETALLAHLREQGVDPAEAQRHHPRLSHRPFDAGWRFQRVTVAHHGATRSVLKGAPETLLQRSALAADERARWLERCARHAADGYRLLAVAEGDGEREHDLSFLGLLLLWDPHRPEVPEALARAREAGVRVLMMTGDHPATALAVARSVGLDAREALTGEALDDLSDAELLAALRRDAVLARVTPGHKLRVVEALKAAGEVVAVTGDGVNDAPALRRAHVGVAMGARGSDVAREVADLVLLDDNFATIVRALEEGRNIAANIRSFLRFLFATNSSEVMVVVVGAVLAAQLGWRDADGALLLPLTAVQILWVNLVSDALPAMALALDRHPAVMQRPPQAPDAPLLDAASLRFVLLGGAALTLVTLGFYAWLPPEEARAVGFMALVLGQLCFTAGARRLEGAPAPNRLLFAAIAACVALQLLAAATPLAPLLALDLLDARGWLLSAAGAALAWAAALALSRWLRPRQRPPRRSAL